MGTLAVSLPTCLGISRVNGSCVLVETEGTDFEIRGHDSGYHVVETPLWHRTIQDSGCQV